MKCKIVARVLFDYEATTTEELSIHEGDMLLITDDTDQDWWEATEKPVDAFQEARSGLVPMTYVEEAQPLALASALYDYDPATDEEIAIREGQLLRVYEKVDADWWFVKQDNNVGLVPASYVEEQSGSGSAAAVPQVSRTPSPELQIAAEQQKHQLLSALGGLGFVKPKSEPKIAPTQLYGPDDLELDKKKKKNSRKVLIGFSEEEAAIYVLDDPTREILTKTPLTQLSSYKDKKTKMILEFVDKEQREYDGDKTVVHNAVAELEKVVKQSKTGAQNSTTPPSQHVGFGGAQVMGGPPPPPPGPSPASMSASSAKQQVTAAPAAVPATPRVSRPAFAVYDYDPVDEGEIEIRENDSLIVLEDWDPDWWLVRHIARNVEGLVPRSYIELEENRKRIEEEEARIRQAEAEEAARVAREREQAAHRREMEEAARRREEEEAAARRRREQEDLARRKREEE
eukprot:jgi/Hompol1/5259/HPOL_004277-RA